MSYPPSAAVREPRAAVLRARLPLSHLTETENSRDAVPAATRAGAAALPGRLAGFALGAVLALAASLFSGAHAGPRLGLVAATAGLLGLLGRELVRSIRERAEESRSILESAHDSFISVDAAGRIRQWNRQAELDFGWSAEEARGREMAELIVPERLRDAHRERLRAALASGEGAALGRRREEVAMRRDGSEFPVEISFSAVQTARGMRVNSFVHDISERRAANAHLREAEERFRRAFDDAAIGMALTSPEGRWLRVNRALCAITGYPAEKLTGIAFREITHPEDRGRDVDALRMMIAGELERFQTEKRYFHADGHVIWISLNVSVVRDEERKALYLISQMQDVSERKQAEERLAYQASHDALTDLPNRSLLDDRMSVALGRLRRTPLPLVVLFCDLDRFKLVNDSFGHDAGDRLLLEAGERLRALVRPSDTVARLGGDEFAILCEEMSPDAAATLARRIGDALADPFEIVPGHEVVVTSSIGIAINRDPSTEPGTLLANADAAMYESKTRGRSRYSFFAPEMRTRASDRLELESELRSALSEGAFDVHFQPQLELAGGRVVGVQALARWEHPQRGLLSASEFVPIAEESELIIGIGGFVLDRAIAETIRWRGNGSADLTVTVNVSARQLSGPELPSMVAEALAHQPLPPEALCLEVTEWAVAEDPESAFEALRDLKDLGVSLAIDEFGIGTSSLGLMRRIPGLDVLKVDRAFVAGLDSGERAGGLVEVILGMAEALGMRAVAEGVESAEQVAALRELKCWAAQGYYISKPLPADEIGTLLASGAQGMHRSFS